MRPPAAGGLAKVKTEVISLDITAGPGDTDTPPLLPPTMLLASAVLGEVALLVQD